MRARFRVSEPGTLKVPSAVPDAGIPILVGIGAYPALAMISGECWIAEAHVVDGYDYNDVYDEWPQEVVAGRGRVTAEHLNDPATLKTMEVPDGFKLFITGCNDQDEGGYAIYTNGWWRKMEEAPATELSEDGDTYLSFGELPKIDDALIPWLYPHRDQ